MTMNLRWIALLCALLLMVGAVGCKPSDELPVETDPIVTETETDAVFETEEPTETEDLVADAKTKAVAELMGYVNTDDYRGGQKALVESAILAGTDAIQAAKSMDEVATALAGAKAAIDAIAKEETPVVGEITVKMDLVNGKKYSITTYNTVVLEAKDGEGKAIAPQNISVSSNGMPMSVTTDDKGKTVCALFLAEGDNTVIVTAKSGDAVKTVTYTVVGAKAEDEATVTVAVEGFTVGLGYLVKPFELKLDEAGIKTLADHFKLDVDTMNDRLNGAYLVTYALESQGHNVTFSGELDRAFALSGVSHVDSSLWNLSDSFRAMLEENNYVVGNVAKQDALSEMDVTSESGWMYSINGSFPEASLSTYKPKNGDVIRVQFTLAKGADIGAASKNNFFDKVDREKLTVLITEALSKGVDVTEALETVSIVMASQKAIDEVYEALSAALGRPVSGITVETSLIRGHVYSGEKLAMDVFAKNKAGYKIDSANVVVLVNGRQAEITCDGENKTGYLLLLDPGENIVSVKATYDGKSETVMVKIFHNPLLNTTVTLAVEGFTVGIGYVLEPISLTLDEKTFEDMAAHFKMDVADLRSSVNGAYLAVYALEKHGYTVLYEGSLDGDFLIKGVLGIETDLCNISGDLQAILEKDGYVVGAIETKGMLGQYDFTSGAAWLYSVNGTFVNKDFSDYKLQNGDVIRMCFTLSEGADVGAKGDKSFFDAVNRDALTGLISEALVQNVDVTSAIEVMTRVRASQKEIDSAYAALAQKMGR